jgi:hypothetical protein
MGVGDMSAILCQQELRGADGGQGNVQSIKPSFRGAFKLPA